MVLTYVLMVRIPPVYNDSNGDVWAHISIEDMSLVTVMQGEAANEQTTHEIKQWYQERLQDTSKTSRSDANPLPPPRPLASPAEMPGSSTDSEKLAERIARKWFPIISKGNCWTADMNLGKRMISILRHDPYILSKMEEDRSVEIDDFL